MHLRGNVRVTVEHEGGRVRVGTHVIENKPVADFSAPEFSFVLIANLVKAVAGGPKHSGRDSLVVVASGFIVNHLGQDLGHGLKVIVDDIVEGAVDSIVDVECLRGTLATLAVVYLGGHGCGAAHKVTTGLSDESELALLRKFELELIDGVTHGLGDSRVGRCIVTVAADVVAGETATDVNHCHGRHTKGISGLEQARSMVERGTVCTGVTAARPNVEADAHDVEVQLLCKLEKPGAVGDGAPKLVRKAANGLLVISSDSQQQLQLFSHGQGVISLSKLVELVLSVEDRALHTTVSREV